MPRTETRQFDRPVEATTRTRVKFAWWLVLAGVAAIVLWVAGDEWLRRELGRVEREIQAGRIDSARSRLQRLSALGLGGVEARYWRGACEEAEGQFETSLATWAEIPPGSKRYANACLRRARLALERGRFAEAEESLQTTQFPRTSQAFAMRDSLLQQVDLFTGQFDNLRRRIEGEWGGTGNPAEILRKRYLVDNPRSFPVDALRSRLEESGRMAPEDDRVWLGKAYLAIRTARFADAEDWLRRCLRRRPEDPAVWRDDLEWAMATDRLAEAVEALRHLPADRLSPEARLSTRAWIAGRLGDTRAEQDALTRWVERAPGELNAVARLIALKARSSRRPEEAADLRRRKAMLDRASDDYRGALADRVPTGQFDELGRLAEVLGRRFEARGWWTLALRESPGSEEARRRSTGSIAASENSRRPIGPTPRRNRAPWPRRWPISSAGPPAKSPFPPPWRPSPSSGTTPRQSGFASSMRTIRRRCPACPSPWAVASGCSTTTATAGWTSTPSRVASSPTIPARRQRPRATACSATAAMARSRM